MILIAFSCPKFEFIIIIPQPHLPFLIHTGLELSFFSGVYSPSIGFTTQIGESAKQLVGLSGIFIGVGEVFGGVSFGLLGARTSNKLGRDPIVILGFIIHLIAFFLIFLNLPNAANLGDTSDIGEWHATF